MNEELEQLDEDQDQSERSDENQSQLIEIYKLHTQLANNISNRRVTTSRFYQVLLSGLIVVFIAFLQNKNDAAVQLPIELVIEILGALGLLLSWSWCMSVESYLLLNSRKYAVLKKLEGELDYQFFKEEWDLLGKNKQNLTYKELSKSERSVPDLFFCLAYVESLIGRLIVYFYVLYLFLRLAVYRWKG